MEVRPGFCIVTENRKEKKMDKVLHRAATRGYADHGWLDTYHTFSFADYYEPKRIHFGALRVLNDDTVAPGEGFGTHPHANMEIVSIPLSGALRHRDSMGYVQELRPGGIQVMSAGTGITHSEFNASDTEPVKFLQIWVLPDARGHRPRYDQLTLAPAVRNELRPIVAPEGFGNEHVGWIHQRAWFHTLDLDAGRGADYRLRLFGDGVYLFVLEGCVETAGETLSRRDGLGICGAGELRIFRSAGEADASHRFCSGTGLHVRRMGFSSDQNSEVKWKRISLKFSCARASA